MVCLQDVPFPVQMHAVNTDYLQDVPFPVQMQTVNTRSVYNTLYLPFPVQVQAVNTRSVSASLQSASVNIK